MGFRVEGQGRRVWGLGLRLCVHCFGPRFYVLRLKVQNSGAPGLPVIPNYLQFDGLRLLNRSNIHCRGLQSRGAAVRGGFLSPCVNAPSYLEGHGDLVNRLQRPTTHIVTTGL